ncbi:histidine phosphatase family protein [Streptomyces sp. NPDC048606]|uniref:histidine phosphatase family protein n=1 Tax=Streptomyces sp. NPDC048606 TaxID=3154726 RepID=UPI0034398658
MPHTAAASGPGRRTVLAAALAAVATAGCTEREEPARPAAGPGAVPKDALVMVIRHAEQPYAGAPGEDDDGNDDPGSLAGRGRRRAHELPRLFVPAPAARLPRPAALFATGGPAGSPARCRQTLAPLATALKTPVRTEFALGAETALARAVLAGHTPALVCWEHTGIPRLVRALGAGDVLGIPAAWPDRHDLLWSLTRTQGTWTFREFPQALLSADARPAG